MSSASIRVNSRRTTAINLDLADHTIEETGGAGALVKDRTAVMLPFRHLQVGDRSRARFFRGMETEAGLQNPQNAPRLQAVGARPTVRSLLEAD
jgi:hypothetical protein